MFSGMSYGPENPIFCSGTTTPKRTSTAAKFSGGRRLFVQQFGVRCTKVIVKSHCKSTAGPLLVGTRRSLLWTGQMKCLPCPQWIIQGVRLIYFSYVIGYLFRKIFIQLAIFINILKNSLFNWLYIYYFIEIDISNWMIWTSLHKYTSLRLDCLQ